MDAALLVHAPYDNNQATNAGTTGSLNDGTLLGGATFTNDTALGNGAVLLDSSLSSYVQHVTTVPGTGGPIVGNQARTLSIWTKNLQLASEGQRTLLSIGNGESGSPNGSKMDVDLDASNGGGVGRIELGVAGGRTSPNYATNATLPAANDGVWRLVTFTWSTNSGLSINGGRVFVDGRLAYVPGTASPQINTGNGGFNDFFVGKSVNSAISFPTVQQYFNGLVDDVSVWSTRLSDSEVLGLYQAGAEATLKYDAGHFAALKAVHDAASGSATIGTRGWDYTGNLTNAAGLHNTSLGYLLVLNTTNQTGVANFNNVAPAITLQPGSITNVVGTSGGLAVGALGKGPLSYQWFQSNAPVAGATTPALDFPSIALSNAGPYFAVVSNSFGAVTSEVVTVTVLGNTPPFMTTQPTNVTVVKGQPVGLEAGVDGSPTLAFQWRKGGVPQPGATSNPYTIPSSAYADQGNWDLVTTNNFGSVTSAVAVVTILDVTPPVLSSATNISVAPAGPAGTVVNLSYISAFDDRDGLVPVTLTPPSGSLFAPGITVVTASATDAGGNSVTEYFTVNVGLGTVSAQTNFFDNFEVSGPSDDINFEHNLSSRQSGVLAPIPYAELTTRAQYGQFDYLTAVGSFAYPGTLYLSPFGPTPNFMSATPAREFLESPTFAVEFDVNPTAGAGTTNWAGVGIGSAYPHVFPDVTVNGFGILFRGTGQIGTILDQQQSLLRNHNPATPLPTPPYRVRLEVEAAAFDGSPAILRGYVNGTPIPLATNAAGGEIFTLVKTNGLVNNYVVLSCFAQLSGVSDNTFDNLTITALPTIFASPPDLATVVGRSNQTFVVTVPPSLVATSAVSVVVSNSNPVVARMLGEAGGQLTLNFLAGGANQQTVTVVGLAAGTTTLALRSPSVAVPLGGKPVTVKVGGLPVRIYNPSFEEPPVPAFPGYGTIPGWVVSDANYNGVSPNLNVGGVIPNNQVSGSGRNVALLQSLSTLFAFDQQISTTISNLTPGMKYEVSFLANAQQGAQSEALMTVLVNGTNALYTKLPAVGPTPLGYKPVSVVFTAAGPTASLAISNTTFNANGLLVDDFQVREVQGRWSYSAWTDDSNSGIWSSNTYAHAYNLGTSTDVTLNGVLFTGVAGGNPSVSNQFTFTGVPAVLNNSPQNNLAGNSALLGNDFVYNAQTPQLTLASLIPGATYRLSIFGGGFGADLGQRGITFSGGGESLSVDENVFGQGNGLIVNCDYVATGSTEVFDGRVLGSGTFHFWAFANQFVAPPAVLNISRVGAQVRLAWSTALTGYTLQSSSTVNSGYANVGTAPVIEGSEFVVYETISGTRYYRLKQ